MPANDKSGRSFEEVFYRDEALAAVVVFFARRLFAAEEPAFFAEPVFGAAFRGGSAPSLPAFADAVPRR